MPPSSRCNDEVGSCSWLEFPLVLDLGAPFFLSSLTFFKCHPRPFTIEILHLTLATTSLLIVLPFSFLIISSSCQWLACRKKSVWRFSCLSLSFPSFTSVVVLKLLFPNFHSHFCCTDAIMALAFLNCSICPKQPSFSDTSHLLTHVSSKGHLSEWHKLQVRSFQDIAAGVALATYNQWCQQHDIDRLLSERMQMKEDKQAKKRKTTTARNTSSKGIPIDHALLNPSNPSKRPAKPKTQGQRKGARSRRERDNDGSDSDFSPVKRPK